MAGQIFENLKKALGMAGGNLLKEGDEVWVKGVVACPMDPDGDYRIRFGKSASFFLNWRDVFSKEEAAGHFAREEASMKADPMFPPEHHQCRSQFIGIDLSKEFIAGTPLRTATVTVKNNLLKPRKIFISQSLLERVTEAEETLLGIWVLRPSGEKIFRFSGDLFPFGKVMKKCQKVRQRYVREVYAPGMSVMSLNTGDRGKVVSIERMSSLGSAETMLTYSVKWDSGSSSTMRSSSVISISNLEQILKGMASKKAEKTAKKMAKASEARR